MDNAQKAIMIGVGLFITIIIIAAVMLITGMGQDLLNSGTKKLSNVSSQLQSELTSNYDNQQLTGSQVLSAIRTYYNDPEIVVAVKNNKAGKTIYVTPKKLTGSDTLSVDSTSSRIVATKGTEANTQPSQGSFTSTASGDVDNRIVTTGQYKSYLIDLNGSVLGIYFERI